MHAKKVFKDFEIQNLGEYYDLYLKSDVLPLADVFENLQKICLKIYELDPVKFLSAHGLASSMTSSFKNEGSKTRTIN